MFNYNKKPTIRIDQELNGPVLILFKFNDNA